MKSVFTLLASSITMCSMITAQTTFELSPAYSDFLRVCVFTLAGVSLGFLSLIVLKFRKLHISKDDRIMRPLAAFALSYFLLTLFISLEIFNQRGLNVTWRTPFAGAAFAIGLPSVVIIKRRITEALEAADENESRIKLTIMDTGKPGLDIDLVHGKTADPK